MKTHRIANYVVVLTLLFAPCQAWRAQERSCVEIDAIVKMARAISTAELAADQLKAGESYRARVVYAARRLELDPQDRNAAVLLLNLIPKGDAQHLLLMALGDHLCGTESYSEMKTLGQIGDRLPRDLARAVLLAPDKMAEYVAYSIASVQDLHSDYAMQMERVCRARHTEFIAAVAKLPAEEKEQFLKYIFDPDGCNALTLPEGE
jgi:hypothetical protein